MITRSFGKLSDGRSAGLYILTNRNGMEVHLTDYGAAIVRLIVPDKDEQFRDVVLGYDDVSGYEKGQSSLGGTVGRFANRISNASFDMNGRHYILTANNGPNTLHGGRDFFVHRLWSPVISFSRVSSRELAAVYAIESMNDWSRENMGVNGIETNALELQEGSNAERINKAGKAEMADTVTRGDSITFTLHTPDGDQGFPGALDLSVTYTLTYANELHIDYKAAFSPQKEQPAIKPSVNSAARQGRASSETWIPVSEHHPADQASGRSIYDEQASEEDGGAIRLQTPLNLTNHSYFNLNGHDRGSVLAHEVSINAEKFTETDSRSVPTGTLLDVKWTPMDFRKPKTLGQDINADYEPLRFGGGYDHNFVLDEEGVHELREAAIMYSADSGIKMTVYTDLPGLQLYTANGLDNEPGKGGAVYSRRGAACFETQFWPDAVNKENFPGGTLSEGEEFTSRTTYKFSIRKAD